MGYIYKIVNTINEKVYIGKTSVSVAHRWDQHKSAAQSGVDWHLYRAMRKYGIDKFSIQTIEEISDDQLNQREIYWINYYNSFKNGYNMTLGGEGRNNLDKKEIVNLWLQGNTVQEISAKFDCWTSSIINILKEENVYDKIRIIKERTINIANIQSQHKIIQYSETGEVINTFNSCKEAALSLNGNPSTIHGAITTKSSRYGYYWAYDDAKELPVFKPIKRSTIRPIYQYSLDNKLIASYNNAAEAQQKTKIMSSSILKVCKGQRKSAGGFFWSYKNQI